MTYGADMAGLSIVVPVLNEADGIAENLARLAPLRQKGAEIIVVDGGSSDGTVAAAAPLADRVVNADRGRAAQMNAGACTARGDLLLFLHADTVLPDHAGARIISALATHCWGRFDVTITGNHAMFPVIAFMMNVRSRLTGIATGDQAIFVRRDAFDALGGYPDQPLMEDIVFSRRARRLGRPACLRAKVSTSGRRWEKHGVWRTILLMWKLRLAYFFGANTEDLAVAYGYRPQQPKQ
jgi:rSAM/selenodomain-associated transferase 2